MFNAARLARLKPTAYLVNTARGGIIDEPCAVYGTVDRQAGWRGLDVYEKEPVQPGQSAADARQRHQRAAHGGRDEGIAGPHGPADSQDILSALDGKPIRENVINEEVLG